MDKNFNEPVRITHIDVYEIDDKGNKCIGLYWEKENGEHGKYVLTFNCNDIDNFTVFGISNNEDDMESKLFLRALFESLIKKTEVCN